MGVGAILTGVGTILNLGANLWGISEQEKQTKKAQKFAEKELAWKQDVTEREMSWKKYQDNLSSLGDIAKGIESKVNADQNLKANLVNLWRGAK